MELVEGPTHADRIAQGDRQARLRREDVAEGLSISRSTVTREWQTARAWMHRHRRLTDGRAQGDP